MKKTVFTATALLISTMTLSLFTGCLTSRVAEPLKEEAAVAENTAEKKPELPDWALTPPREEGYYFGIGAGPDYDTAKLKSMINLSQQFQLHVHAQLHERTKGEKGESLIKSMDRQITDYDVVGAKYYKQHQSGDGEYWILTRAPLDCILDVVQSVCIDYKLDQEIGKAELEEMIEGIGEEVEKATEYYDEIAEARKTWKSIHENIANIPGGSFPYQDEETVSINDFSLGKTEVTWEQWKGVYYWAVNNGYHFEYPGQSGSYTAQGTNQPVTAITWYDAVVWCNATTEMVNKINSSRIKTVYNYNEKPIRDSREDHWETLDTVIPDTKAGGFRLPTSHEWEYAARYQDGRTWTPLDHASGASSDYNNEYATGKVAWYWKNSGEKPLSGDWDSDIIDANDGKSHPVGKKQPNKLGLYDMSGNVTEWCFDRFPGEPGSAQVLRSGSWCDEAYAMPVGLVYGDSPDSRFANYGFRLACAPW